MKKITFSIALSLCALASVAQKTVLANGGRFGIQSENVTISIYDTQLKTSVTIDTIHTQSVQDVLVDGNAAIVAAQDSIVRYDLSSYQRTAAVKFAGVSTKSLVLGPNNELVVSNWYGKTGYNIYIYNPMTLALLDSINIASGVGCMLVNPALDLLVVTQNQSTGAPNYQDTLGTLVAATLSTRSIIGNLPITNYTGDVGEMLVKPNGTGVYIFNSISNTIIDVNATVFPFVTTTVIPTNQNLKVSNRSQYAVRGDTAFLRMNQGIGSYNLSNLTMIDSNLIDTVVTAFTYDTLNHKFYVTSTDFFSYTSGKVYNRSGNYVESFSTASSPEAIKMFYSQATGILSFSTQSKQQYSLYPNPAKNHFSVNGAFDSETTIQIFGSNGKLVKQMSQVNGFNQIDISELSSGLYIVNIFNKGEVATEKLMVR